MWLQVPLEREIVTLKLVVSGGQTGVDQAALFAAKQCGIETGGWAPKGWVTQVGPNVELLRDTFGLQECPTSGYKARTWRNVRNSDATLRLARTFSTPGERCTMNAIRYYGKRSLDVDLTLQNGLDPPFVVQWLLDEQITVLNVAGNSEQTSRGIGIQAAAYLILVFTQLKKLGDKQMAEPTKKAPEIDAFIKNVMGKSRPDTIRSGGCMTCTEPDMNFRTAPDRTEYSISGMCQKCQDSVFGDAEDEDR